MRIKPSILLSLLVIVLSGWAVLTARAWPWKAALFPLVIGTPVLILAGIELLLELFSSGRQPQGQHMDFQLSEHLPKEVVLRRTATIFLWLFGFFVAIVLIGFPIAVPLFVFLYLKVQGREGWLLSTISTILAWGFFYVLFIRALNLPFPSGWLVTWLLG
jgi:hypothetical protein